MYNRVEAECIRNIVLYCIEDGEILPIPEEVTKDRISQIARENHLQMMLGKYLLDSNAVDGDTRSSWTAYCLKMIFHSAKQMNEFQKIQEAFEKWGIKNLPLKGAFMKQYYGKPELRQMSDLDICVEEGELLRAKEVMESLGYTLHESVKNHDVYKKDKYMEVEIHKCLYKQELDKKQHDYFGSLERAILDEGKEYCYHQTLEDFYIYLIAHMAGHFYERGCGVRNLVDIYVFLKKFEKEMNTKYVMKSLQECGLADFEKQVRKLSFMWLQDGEIKEEFYGNLFGFMLNCGIYGKEQYGVWKEYAKLNKEKLNAKEMKLRYVFPNLSYLKKDFPILRKAPILLPFVWIYRILRGLICGRGIERREYIQNAQNEENDVILEIYRKMNFEFEEETANG